MLESRAVVLPNFLVVGAMKAGTSWLSEMLDEHPGVFVAQQEPHFFNNTANYARGLDWYEAWFEGADGYAAVGEKTAGYLLGRDFLPLIAETLPGVRILAVLRNPVSRAVSQINHHLRYGDIAMPNTDDWLRSDDFARIDERFAILERGHYAEQLARYFEILGRDRVHVVLNEADIRRRPAETVRDACRFLGVDEDDFEVPADERRVHENRNSRLGVSLARRIPVPARPILRVDRNLPGRKSLPYVPSEDDRAVLIDHYRPGEEALAELIGRPEVRGWSQ